LNVLNLERLFHKITEVTTIADVGFHIIEKGYLNPIYKTQTEVLGLERWKDEHQRNPVYVKDTLILREIMAKKQPIIINNTKQDNRSANEFFFFGIDSIMIIPVINQEEVKGIICIVSIGEPHQFTKKEMDICIRLIDEYLKNQG
jgi:acetolactate synthase-1/2/3 large subunit